MKKTPFLATVLCLALLADAGAAERQSKKPTSKAAAKSHMIQIPPPAKQEGEQVEQAALITTDLSGRDIQFLNAAIEAGMLQAFLGERARTKAATPEIKALGETLYSRQLNENRELARIASLKGLIVSHTPPAQQKKIDEELRELSGPKFDKACLEHIATVNQQAVEAYEAGVQSKDGDLKGLAATMLPMAKQKLQIANQMAGRSTRTNTTPGFRANAAAAPDGE